MENKNSITTKQDLKEIYSRPETKPFERLDALMNYYSNSLRKESAGPLPANTAFPKAAKLFIPILFAILSFGISGCAKEDACAHTVCMNGGICRDGKCFCEKWYEGANCATEMREKFYGTWDGQLDDGSGTASVTFQIPISSGSSVEKIIFVFDGLPIKANLVNSNTLNIPDQTINTGGVSFNLHGSGTCPTNSSIIIDFLMLTNGAEPTVYHFTGNK